MLSPAAWALAIILLTPSPGQAGSALQQLLLGITFLLPKSPRTPQHQQTSLFMKDAFTCVALSLNGFWLRENLGFPCSFRGRVLLQIIL